MKLGNEKWIVKGLLIILALVVLSGETSDIEDQLDTCVWVEVNVEHGQNKSETSCEAPEKPSNGGYVSDPDVGGHSYSTGDIIRYFCNRGHRLIGQTNRTCNGTSKGWEPDEPYCEPEYIGHLLQRLNGIEDQMRKFDGIQERLKAIEQRITTVEDNTLHVGHNVSGLENNVNAMNNTILTMNNKLSSIDNNMSTIYKMSITQSLRWQIDRERLLACTDITKEISQDTVTKCKTMQMGVRNGRSVSVYTWVIEDFKNKVAKRLHFSPPFYHTVPGYKISLGGYIYEGGDIHISLQLLPGEYDDQLKWPFSKNYDTIVLMNDGVETQRRYLTREKSNCHLDRRTSATTFQCFNDDPNWDAVWTNNKHILNNGSVVVKMYFYN